MQQSLRRRVFLLCNAPILMVTDWSSASAMQTGALCLNAEIHERECGFPRVVQPSHTLGATQLRYRAIA